ncbi:MAG: DUF1893 domain-containing protein [Deltaproteobacteria bacterium]|nr:DUF1893 domain-containing protein [Deltaproteobacteria bacterium]
MLIPDFSRYSLALVEGETIIYSSNGAGLRPLWDALKMFHDRSGLTLHDKVMGLAAARLIVYSGVVAGVVTKVASMPARRFLRENGIALSADGVADNILTRDKSSVCPGEVIALSTDDPKVFLQKIDAMMGLQVQSIANAPRAAGNL